MINDDVIQSLYQVDGYPYLVSSLYMDIPPEQSPKQLITHFKGLTDQVRKNALKEKTEEVRESVELDVKWFREEIEQREEIRSDQTRSIAFFSCSAQNYREGFKFSTKTENTVHVHRYPYVRPLSRLLDQNHRTLVVCIDRRYARLLDLFLNRIETEESLESDVPDRVRTGGYEGYEGKGISRQVDPEKRVSRHIEDHVDHHLKKVEGLARTKFDKKGYDFIVLAGHKETIDRFRKLLPSRMEERIQGSFACKPEVISKDEIREKVEPIIEEGEREKEQNRVAEIKDHLSAGGGPVVTGLGETLQAINRGNIRLLVLDEELELNGNECSFCGHLDVGGAQPCDVCDRLTQPVEDLVDRMIGATLERGGSVEHFVSGDDFIREHEVCAVLRYT